MKNVNVEHELSRPLQVDRVPLGGMTEHIVASPDERAALAARFSLREIASLEANLDIDRAEGKMFAVTGKLFADVVQDCVVTLEPLPDHVTDNIDVLFAPPHLAENDREGALPDLGDAEPPEPIVNGIIDLGELVAQHFATALNPYPRKEGAEVGVYEVGTKTNPLENKANNPFAKLAEMAKNKGKTEG